MSLDIEIDVPPIVWDIAEPALNLETYEALSFEVPDFPDAVTSYVVHLGDQVVHLGNPVYTLVPAP